MARSPLRIGVVLGFDDPAGLGTLRGDDGAEVRFHCTALDDGSRTIEPGTRVAYTLGRSWDGALEAVGVSPVPPTAP